MSRIYADMRRIHAEYMRICAKYMRYICRMHIERVRDIGRIYTGYTMEIGEGNGAVFKETYDRECYLGQ